MSTMGMYKHQAVFSVMAWVASHYKSLNRQSPTCSQYKHDSDELLLLNQFYTVQSSEQITINL